jgi:hypothetical protein
MESMLLEFEICLHSMDQSHGLISLFLQETLGEYVFNREVFRGAIVANENDVSVTLPATVEKVLPARDAEPEKIQISVDGCDELFSELRVENTLKNESGDSVTLKRGAHIEVTINADSDAVKKKE